MTSSFSLFGLVLASGSLGLLVGQTTSGDWKTGDAATRNQALSELVRRHPPDIANVLNEAMEDPDMGVRQIAFSNLDLFGRDPRLAPALRRHLSIEPVETRWMVARAIAMNPVALTALRDLAGPLAASRDPLLRDAFLANIAPGAGVEFTQPILLRAIESAEPGDRMAAAQSLQRLGIGLPGRTEANLLADLGSENLEAAGSASYALFALWNHQIGEHLRRLLRSGSLLQRARAADLLRKRDEPFDPSPLSDVVRRGSEDAALAVC